MATGSGSNGTESIAGTGQVAAVYHRHAPAVELLILVGRGCPLLVQTLRRNTVNVSSVANGKTRPAGMRAFSLGLVGLRFRVRDKVGVSVRDRVGVNVSDGVRVSTFYFLSH